MKILVLNSGSSSQKSSLYEIGDTLPERAPDPLWQAKVEWVGGLAEVRIRDSSGGEFKNRMKIESRKQALDYLFGSLRDGNLRGVATPSEIDVVGHRVVHGGSKFEEPILVTREVKEAIASVSAFAPLHNRSELEGIELMEELLGSVPQIAVFGCTACGRALDRWSQRSAVWTHRFSRRELERISQRCETQSAPDLAISAYTWTRTRIGSPRLIKISRRAIRGRAYWSSVRRRSGLLLGSVGGCAQGVEAFRSSLLVSSFQKTARWSE